jgi:VCBS repeat protein
MEEQTMHILTLGLVAAMAIVGAADGEAVLKFDKARIGEVNYEAASACDVNQDGVLDIVSGEYWFVGPEFKTKHKICTILAQSGYYDDFSDYPMDVNGDGFPDIISGGWFGQVMVWRENPKGKTGEWTVHEIAKVGNVERACHYDIDGDGDMEVIPNTPSAPLRVFKLVRDAQGKGTGQFKETVVRQENQGHGLGFGDINGDGRVDIVLTAGWLEAPKDPYTEKWSWHPEFTLVHASVPVLVHDVNGDGVNDLIVGNGHGYGLDWYGQKVDAEGKRTWTKNEIDPKRSQYHEMQLLDIDNDGAVELVTGKRYHAHNGSDPGGDDPVGLYYFEINGGNFVRHTIDYGPAGTASGAGIYFWAEDLDGNGWKDIIAPGKEGLYLFKNLGKI